MAEYIEREAVLKMEFDALTLTSEGKLFVWIKDIADFVKAQPAADVVPKAYCDECAKKQQNAS